MKTKEKTPMKEDPVNIPAAQVEVDYYTGFDVNSITGTTTI